MCTKINISLWEMGFLVTLFFFSLVCFLLAVIFPLKDLTYLLKHT